MQKALEARVFPTIINLIPPDAPEATMREKVNTRQVLLLIFNLAFATSAMAAGKSAVDLAPVDMASAAPSSRV